MSLRTVAEETLTPGGRGDVARADGLGRLDVLLTTARRIVALRSSSMGIVVGVGRRRDRR